MSLNLVIYVFKFMFLNLILAFEEVSHMCILRIVQREYYDDYVTVMMNMIN